MLRGCYNLYATILMQKNNFFHAFFSGLMPQKESRWIHQTIINFINHAFRGSFLNDVMGWSGWMVIIPQFWMKGQPTIDHMMASARKTPKLKETPELVTKPHNLNPSSWTKKHLSEVMVNMRFREDDPKFGFWPWQWFRNDDYLGHQTSRGWHPR